MGERRGKEGDEKVKEKRWPGKGKTGG